jgi:c-di-GMP-binding flagellar brake protein YcgR
VDEPLREQRKHARAHVKGNAVELSLSAQNTVQVLDISQTGMLLSAPQPLAIGQRAQIKTRLGAEPVTLPVVVRRVTNGIRTGHGSYRLGCEFVGLDEENRKKIGRFLKVD